MSSQAGTIATWTLAVTASCLRFVARRSSKAGLWYDDWLIIPAMLVATALCIVSFLGWYGRDFNRTAMRFMIFVFVDEACWTIAIWMVKYSILAFYWRLFAVNRRAVRVVIWALTAFVTCWGIAAVAVIAIHCFVNTSAYTSDDNINDNEAAAFYGNLGWVYLGSWVPHIFIDLVLLCLPVPLLWKLQMQKTQKVILTAVFACGGLVTIISIIRLANLFSLRSGNTIIWSNVEANCSIICACLPSLRPILSLVSDKLKRLRKRKSTHRRGSELLMDMLPVRKPASPASTLSKRQSWKDGPYPMLDSSVVTEVEAKTVRAPELDAEAPGPHIIEIETAEPALEIASQTPMAELEGRDQCPAEL